MRLAIQAQAARAASACSGLCHSMNYQGHTMLISDICYSKLRLFNDACTSCLSSFCMLLPLPQNEAFRL